MALIGFETPPVFENGMPISWADMKILRDNAILLDALSFRGRRAWLDQTYLFSDYGGSPSPLTSAAFQYRTGLTTATFVLGAAFPGGGSHTLQILFNEVLVYNSALAAGTSTVTVSLGALGYSDLQIIEVKVRIAWTGTIGIYRLYDAYVGPASALVGTFPGLVSFGALSTSNLNTLAASQQWLMDRMNVVLQPAFEELLNRPMQFWPGSLLLWQGSIARGNGANRLRIPIHYQILSNQAEYLTIEINEVVIETGPTWAAPDEADYEFLIDLSGYTDEAMLFIRITQHIVTGEAPGVRPLGSRYSIGDIYTDRTSYPFATPPAVSTPRESITFSTLQSRLNTIGFMMSQAYNRVIAANDIFDRIRLFRGRPALDDFQKSYFQELYVPHGRRAHDALWVRGKGLKLAWGAMKVDQVPNELWDTTWSNEVELIGGDTVQDKLVYFDSFAGLYPGADYWVIGNDVRYVAEQLR